VCDTTDVPEADAAVVVAAAEVVECTSNDVVAALLRTATFIMYYTIAAS